VYGSYCRHEDDNRFESKLKKLLADAKNGAVTISRQDGRTLHLTITETRDGLRLDGGTRGVAVTEEEFLRLLQYVESVKYGTVVVKIQDGRITGVEKNEKIKL
jgi:hypothetical protein